MTVVRSFRAKRSEEGAVVGIKDLDAVVVGITNENDVVVKVDKDVIGTVELAFLSSHNPKGHLGHFFGFQVLDVFFDLEHPGESSLLLRHCL